MDKSLEVKNMDSAVMILILVVAIVVGIAFYFIPAIIGFKRQHPNKAAILCVDLLLGWSFIGWVVALVWACTNTNTNKNN